ncbi:hypothetical protein P8605_49490, partial [Streptomyces sp. T-3]|nr:hypothetical protein [Streptomyces sp. T-3]
MGAEVVHRLGAALLLMAAVTGVVWAVVAGRRERRVRRRLGVMFGVRRTGRRRPAWRVVGGGWPPVVGVACAGFVLVGGVLGCLLGIAAGYGVRRWLRLRERGRPPVEVEAGPQLPLAADLLAA